MQNIYRVLFETIRSYAFAYMLRHMLTMSAVVLAMLVVIYGIFSYRYFHQVHQELSQELDNVSSIYYEGGPKSIDEYISATALQWDSQHFAYIVVDKNFNKLAGNLKQWPSFTQFGDGWLNFELGIRSVGSHPENDQFVARSIQLPNENHLLVARSSTQVLKTIRVVFGVLVNGFIFSVLAGMMGAFVISSNILQRFKIFNKSIDSIMSGNYSERITVNDQPSEIEGLAMHLNAMLDQIQDLMDGVKQVSDNIAHDLRTPLTRLRNKLATHERHCKEEDKESVRDLIEEADNLFATFNALLRIARIELGEAQQQKGVIMLDQLVEEVLELYEPVAAEKLVAVSTKLTKCAIDGDRNLIFQAIANVIDNAIKYTPGSGSVEVELEQTLVQALSNSYAKDQMMVVLKVNDTGCGIPKKNLRKVFRRFYREDSSRGVQPGNGLGLSLVLAVMKMHDASVELENRLPGLTFKMSFPSSETLDHETKDLKNDSRDLPIHQSVLSTVNPEVSTSTGS